jgi:hypothetical protein
MQGEQAHAWPNANDEMNGEEPKARSEQVSNYVQVKTHLCPKPEEAKMGHRECWRATIYTGGRSKNSPCDA